MKSLVARIFKQLVGDRRSMAMLLLAPILVVSLLYLLLGDSAYQPTIAVDSRYPAPMLAALQKQDVTVVILSDGTDADAKLENNEIDAMVTFDANGLSIRMAEAGSAKTAKITSALKAAAASVNPAGGMRFTSIYGDTASSTFDSLDYVLLGVMSFFFVFILSGVSFIRERSSGTLERLMLTPVRRYEVIVGYTLGFGVFAVIQSVVFVLFTQYVLGVHIAGSVWLTMLVMILLSFTAVSTGTLISIFANNEFQVVQFIPVVIIPQIFFSGLIPIDTFPLHLGNLSYIMPVYYGCTALNEVMVKGFGIGKIWPNLVMLLAFVLVLSVVNTLALKKYRRM